MSLSAPRSFFGVHSFTPYSRTDATFYGTVKVLKSSSLAFNGELVDLMGGSNKYSWAIEEGPITAEISLKFGQFEDFLFTLFLGKTPTALSAETSGNVSTLTNFKGTSVMNATTGISAVASIAASVANLKFGKYVVKAVSSTTVDLFLSSDCDLGRGTNGEYTTDGLKIAAAQTITASTDTELADYGIKFTGGSGTIGMTTGDTATFEVRPVGLAGGMTVRVGGLADQSFPEFGCIIMGQKRGNQEMVEIDLFRCKAAGMPLTFEQNAWSEAEVKVKAMYDADKDGVFDLRAVKAA